MERAPQPNSFLLALNGSDQDHTAVEASAPFRALDCSSKGAETRSATAGFVSREGLEPGCWKL